MIIHETLTINGRQFRYTYSDDGHILRCGRLKYVNAVDPIDSDKYYFEEGVVEQNTEDGQE